MATPTRTAPLDGLKIPNGRFWIGKCESGATSINDFIVSFAGTVPTLQKFQRPQIIARFIETAAAQRRNQLAMPTDPFSPDLPFAPGETIVRKSEGSGVFVIEHSNNLGLVPMMLEREHACAENVEEPVHLRLDTLVKKPDRVMQPRRELNRHVLIARGRKRRRDLGR